MTFTLSEKIQGNTIGGIGVFTCTYSNPGSETGGAIDTGFTKLYHYSASNNASTTKVQMTASGGTVTLTTGAGDDGTFMAIGV